MSLLESKGAKPRPDRPDTRKPKDRLTALRQEDHRAYLSEHNGIKQIVEKIIVIETDGISMDPQELQAKKFALDARLKLLSKYLPDLKSIEMSGDLEHSGGLTITWQK